MAGDWIKLEVTTPGKPEIDGIARALGVDHDSAFGKCVRFWIWADQQSIDGDDLRVTTDFIDRHVVNSPGFSAALLSVGWLQARSGSLVIPRFARHNGQSAKSRALARDRKSRSRHAHSVTPSSLSLHSVSPPDSEPEDSETQGKSARSVSRETSDPPGFAAWWTAWPKHHRKVGKSQCRDYWRAHTLEPIADRVLAALERSKRSPDWNSTTKDLKPLPRSWLGKTPWETDDAEIAPAKPTPEQASRRRLSRLEQDGQGWIAALHKAKSDAAYKSAPRDARRWLDSLTGPDLTDHAVRAIAAQLRNLLDHNGLKIAE